MDEIDYMETMGLPVVRWSGLRIWNAIDFVVMLQLRQWKKNVRSRDQRKRRYTLIKCIRCHRTKRLSRHHHWNKLKSHDCRIGLVEIVCRKCHRKAEAA